MITDDKKKPEQAAVTPSGMPDLNALRLPQDFAAKVGVRNQMAHVPGDEATEGLVCEEPTRR